MNRKEEAKSNPNSKKKERKPTKIEQLERGLWWKCSTKRKREEKERIRAERELIERFQKARKIERLPPKGGEKGNAEAEEKLTQEKVKVKEKIESEALVELMRAIKKDTEEIRKENSELKKRNKRIKRGVAKK